MALCGWWNECPSLYVGYEVIRLNEGDCDVTATMSMGRVGDKLPELSLPLLEGGELDFSDLEGKRLLLFFWGSW